MDVGMGLRRGSKPSPWSLVLSPSVHGGGSDHHEELTLMQAMGRLRLLRSAVGASARRGGPRFGKGCRRRRGAAPARR